MGKPRQNIQILNLIETTHLVMKILKAIFLILLKKIRKIIIACSSLGSSERVAKILINNGILSNFKNLESFKNIDQKYLFNSLKLK